MLYKLLLDHLKPLGTSTKVMFGNHSIYIANKIYLTARENPTDLRDNGVWIGTSFEHHESLKSEFPSLTHLQAKNVKKWLLLPSYANDFDPTIIQICDLIKKGDQRIGVLVKR